MRKAFMGARLQRLREERGLTQAALAKLLELSPSYLNQLERNQRPLTVPVLLRINAVFGVDVQMFSEDEETRLIADLREALSESGTGADVSLSEIKGLAGAPWWRCIAGREPATSGWKRWPPPWALRWRAWPWHRR
jgi:XRE family transcriptional regulator, fatty acid utilization regulator